MMRVGAHALILAVFFANGPAPSVSEASPIIASPPPPFHFAVDPLPTLSGFNFPSRSASLLLFHGTTVVRLWSDSSPLACAKETRAGGGSTLTRPCNAQD
eukprot:3941282-Rhodomonas_salina.3